MNQPSQNFFAGATLTQQQNRNIDIRDQRRLRSDLPHRRTGRNKEHIVAKLFHSLRG